MRRTLALVVLLAVPALAQDTPKPFSLFARSQHYSINIDVVPMASHSEYNVTVVDLATNAVVAQPHMTAASSDGDTADADVNDTHVHIAIRPFRSQLSAALEVSKGDTVIDSIRTMWALEPYERRAGMGMPIIGGVIGGTVAAQRRPLPPDTYRVGGDVKAPRVITRVEPTYPEAARKARISGVVIVEALIDKTGVVRDVQVLKPLPFGLDQAAVDAVKQWQFEPGTLNGKPVNVVFDLTVNFKMATPPKPRQQ